MEKDPKDKREQKKPIQVYLDSKRNAELSFVADKLNLSKAEVIRRSLDEYLIDAIPAEDDPLMGIIGLLGDDSGLPEDLSENHDHYLAKWEQKRNARG